MPATEVFAFAWSWICLLLGVHLAISFLQRTASDGMVDGNSLLFVVFASLILVDVEGNSRFWAGIAAFFVGFAVAALWDRLHARCDQHKGRQKWMG